MRVFLAALLGLWLAIVSAGCSKPPAAPDDQVTITLASSSSPNTAILTIRSASMGLQWEMIDFDRDTRVAGVLRLGRVADGTIDDVVKELSDAFGRAGGASSTEPREYSLSATFSVNNERGGLIVHTNDAALLDASLPRGGVFELVWKEATGIPKMFWYRDVGPIEESGRAVVRKK